jgi:succinate dehydrogenase / fumarate reductase cytochrome b subunit
MRPSVLDQSQRDCRNVAISKSNRPVFFNLMQIQMPVGALTSISHRVTGVFLAAGVPFSIYLLDLSLRDPQSFGRVASLFDGLPFRGTVILFVWLLTQHLLAGIRHLLSDIDIGSQLPAARRSAWIVNLSGLAVALLAAGLLL